MLKRFFSFSFNEDPHNGVGYNGASNHNGISDHSVAVMERRNGTSHTSGAAEAATAVAELPAEPEPVPEPEPRAARTAEPSLSFEDIYQNATVKPPQLSWGILKVAEMVNSGHLAGLAPDAKRCSLLMALEAAGAEVEDLLQDAVVRQRALNDYEDVQSKALKEFEDRKLEENRGIQAELDRLTADYLSRIQANLDEVASAQDRFRVWQKQKQHESQRIVDAAAFCVPHASGDVNNLAAVLERAAVARR